MRKALRNEAMRFVDETARAQEVFTELYEVLLETGERDGFRPAPERTYRTMLADVRELKSKFTRSGPVDAPGAWDVPVKSSVHKTLAMALGAKRAAGPLGRAER